MADFGALPAHDEDGNVFVVVEAPKGSGFKLKFEPTLQVFVFDRALQVGITYPYDWGFIPSTCAADGDPLDAMVIFDAPTAPGVVIPSVPIGLISVVQRETKGAPKQRNDRVIALPIGDDRYTTLRDVPRRVRAELEQFFVTVGEMTGKQVTIEGWRGPKAARKAIQDAARHHQRGRRAS